MALDTVAISNAIAALTVSGVSCVGISAIPKAVKKGDLPLFFPHPSEWFQGTKSEPLPGEQYVGQAGVYDALRTFRYIYLHAPSTGANSLASIYPAMAPKVDLLYSAIAGLNSTAGVLTVRSIAISEFGEIAAPAVGTSSVRNIFYGCFFTIEILELSTS